MRFDHVASFIVNPDDALVTIIEIRPFRNGWKCFEAPGVEPVFLNQEDAIDYAKGRACFRPQIKAPRENATTNTLTTANPFPRGAQTASGANPKVSAQLEASNPAPQVVNNNR